MVLVVLVVQEEEAVREAEEEAAARAAARLLDTDPDERVARAQPAHQRREPGLRGGGVGRQRRGAHLPAEERRGGTVW